MRKVSFFLLVFVFCSCANGLIGKGYGSATNGKHPFFINETVAANYSTETKQQNAKSFDITQSRTEDVNGHHGQQSVKPPKPKPTHAKFK